MTLYLRSANLWPAIKSIPGVITPAWSRENNKALVDLHNACESNQQDFITECNHAKEAWDKLVEIYKTTDAATIQQLYNKFNNVRKKSEDTMVVYIAKVTAAARALTAVGKQVLDRNIMNRMIEGLGKDYNTLRVGLSLIEKLDKRRLTTVLLEEEFRKALMKEQRSRYLSVLPQKGPKPSGDQKATY